MSPAWFLQSTEDAKLANVKVSMVKVKVGVSVEDKKSAGDAIESSVVDLPMFVNKKGVSKGTELFYNKPNDGDATGGVKRPFDLI